MTPAALSWADTRLVSCVVESTVISPSDVAQRQTLAALKRGGSRVSEPETAPNRRTGRMRTKRDRDPDEEHRDRGADGDGRLGMGRPSREVSARGLQVRQARQDARRWPT